MEELPQSVPGRHVPLATLSFAVCFAAWGLIGAFAPRFRELYHLSGAQTALAVAVPVLLGSLGRIPAGMLADRFGGKRVFTALMVLVAIPTAAVPFTHSYTQLLLVGFFLGLAGSSFPIGVGYVSRWTPASCQGSALGVYGLGNAGQSFAAFGGPLLAGLLGMQGVFYAVSVLLILWAVVFTALAKDAPVVVTSKSLRGMLLVMTQNRLSWALAAFYFVTFGGYVAFSIYLPTLLKDQFGLSPADAGFRTAGFVAVATLLRPAGAGWRTRSAGLACYPRFSLPRRLSPC